MGRRSAGGNREQHSVADLLRAAAASQTQTGPRRHAKTEPESEGYDGQSVELGTPVQEINSPPAPSTTAQMSITEPAQAPRTAPDPERDLEPNSSPASTVRAEFLHGNAGPRTTQISASSDEVASAFAFLPGADTAVRTTEPPAAVSDERPRSPAANSTDDMDTGRLPIVEPAPIEIEPQPSEADLSSSKVEPQPDESEPTLDTAESAPTDAAAARQVSADPGSRSGATSWLLAVGEVVLAIVIGAGLAYVFRLLWDIYPYVAAVIAPVVICGVIGIVGYTRKRLNQGSIPLSLLLVILFITGLLVVLPAAWVMTTR